MCSERTLPDRRHSWRQKANIAGVVVYLTCGEHDDGALGEIFVDVSRAGSALRAVMDAFARTFSVALQHGTPLNVLVECNKDHGFLPCGAVKSEGSGVKSCASIVDWVAKTLEETYLAKTDSSSTRRL